MNRCSFLYRKIVRNIRERGIVETVRRALRDVWQEITTGGQHLFSLPCAELPDAAFSLPEGLTIEHYPAREMIPPAYLDKLAVQVRKKHMCEEMVAYYVEQLLRLFRDGASLTVAMMDGRIVANLWTLRGNGNYQPYFSLFPLAPDEAVVFAGFSLPGFRGLNLMPALIRFNAEAMGRKGVRQVFATCKVWNEASRRCIVKSGMRQIGTARPLRIFSRWVVIWKREENNET